MPQKIKILWFHIPNELPHMIETRLLMQKLRSKGYDIESITTPKEDDHAIYDGLLKWWNKGFDIVICGQDNVFTEIQLQSMVKCSHEICAIPCLMYPESTGLKGVYLNMISNQALHEFESKHEYCTGIMGTGLCMIKHRIQKNLPLNNYPFHWQSLDSTLSRMFHNCGYHNYHLHYPIHKHNKNTGWTHLIR